MRTALPFVAVATLLATAASRNAGDAAPKLILKAHRDNVYSLAVSPDRSWLVSASEDMTACVWDWRAGKVAARLERDGPVYEAAFSPNGEWLATADGDAKVCLYATKDFRLVRVLEGHTGPVYALAFSPDGKWLATGSGEKDYTCRVWDVATGKCVSTLRGHKGAIYGVAFSSNGSLATSSEDKTVRLWDWQPGKSRVMVGHTSYVYRCRFSPDGKYLASASHDRTVRIWNVSTGELVQTLQFSKQPVYAMAFSPNGVLLACVGEEHAVQVMDWRTGRIVQTLTGPKDALYAVIWFTAAGKNYLMFGGAETQVTIMEADWAKSETLERQ